MKDCAGKMGACRAIAGMRSMTSVTFDKDQRFQVSDGVLSFRGTIDWADILRESRIGKRRWYDGGAVHTGFYAQYKMLQEEVHARTRDVPVDIVTGHSLGGVLAVLFAHDMSRMSRPPSAVYTFGCPRIGNADFSSLDRDWTVYRIENTEDIVTRVPPRCSHVGRPISVTFDRGSLFKNHCIRQYTRELQGVLDVDRFPL